VLLYMCYVTILTTIISRVFSVKTSAQLKKKTTLISFKFFISFAVVISYLEIISFKLKY